MDLFLAQIILVPYGSVPNGTLPCDGRLLTIASNNALFSLIGTNFGGDGRTNFALPDLRSITPPSMIYAIITSGVFPSRS
jgi:microcystin-dependent protein